MSIWQNLHPDLMLESIYELDLSFLEEKGIRGVILDMDNTLLPFGTTEVDEQMIQWVESLKEAGYRLCVVSNSAQQKGDNLTSRVGIPAIWHATKPRRGAFRRALQKMELNPEEAVAIGDQVFTDVLGGNRLGLFTILVPQLGSKDFIWTRMMRRLERKVLRQIQEGVGVKNK